MKKNVLTITFLIALISFLACDSIKKNELLKNLNYHNLINEAENCVLNEEYSNAVVYYKKAFEINFKPYAKNCFTAAQVSATCNSLDDFIFFTRKAFKSGITYLDITKDSIIIDFMIQNHLEKKLNNYFIEDIKIYTKNINHKLKSEVEELSALDNKWKIYYNDSLSNIDIDNKEKYSKIYDSIVAEIIEKKLMPLIEKHGYPSEQTIGIEKVGSITNNNYTFSNNKVLFILLHYYSSPRDCRYNELLKNELKNGNLNPRQYASIIDFQNKYGTNICNEYYYAEWHKPENIDINEINSRRIKIGLESYDQQMKKTNRGKEMCKQIREQKKHKIIKLFSWCG